MKIGAGGARTRRFKCKECSEEFECHARPGQQYPLCENCDAEAQLAARRAHLDQLKALPIEERVARIEALLYDAEKR